MNKEALFLSLTITFDLTAIIAAIVVIRSKGLMNPIVALVPVVIGVVFLLMYQAEHRKR